MNYLVKWGRVIFTCYSFLLFLLVFFIIFPAVVISSFFGRIKGGNAIYSLCRFWADAVFLFCGLRHRTIYEAPNDIKKPSVFVFNHISYIDIPVIMKAIRKQPVRILGKAEMAKIPLFGFLYRKAVVMVERDNPINRAKSVVQLKALLKKNISIVISPEGTFNTTGQPLKAFYDGAFRIAIETQTPIRPILFLDMHDRMSNERFFSMNPGKCRVVYLDPIDTTGMSIVETPALKQKVYDLMEAGLIKYKASWIKSMP
ncbi:MAG: lysophospholipid acyltransferase family protein [Ferruginibacter sp.]